MTDFYKKYYGYEDNIKLKDDDIRKLEEGMNLKKLNGNKEEFNERFYRLDTNLNVLVATTKEFLKKEKIYELTLLSEVKEGCSSDNLKSFQLKNSLNDRKKIPEIEDKSFVIVYDNFKKSLDLLAPSKAHRDIWVRVLSYFIILTKKRKGVLPEADKIMTNYFELADKSKNKRLNKNEITEFLDSINIKLKKDQLKQLIQDSDTNNDGELSQEEFEKFIGQLSRRKEIMSLYKLIASGEQKSDINFLPEFITVDKFRTFLEKYQKESKSLEECKEIIRHFEPSDAKEEFKFSLYGFISYMKDPHNFIDDLEKTSKVYMKMDHSFASYFINSSHNTYLSGDQITSDTRPDCYMTAIMRGARLLEMDVHDGSDGKPRIFHKKTLTNKILFEDAIKVCRDNAFKISNFPLIITIELHCTPKQQLVMVDIIKKHLYEYLYLEDIDENNYPSLKDLEKKIIIRCQKPKKQPENSTIKKMTFTSKNSSKSLSMDASYDDDDQYDDDVDDESYEEIKELEDVITVIQNASFKGIEFALNNYSKGKSSSLSEPKCNKLLEEERAQDIIKYTANFCTKVYPAFYRQDSTNLKPLDYWIYGFQIAALNFQTDDLSMDLNDALFADNGGCGYVLKPRILTDPTLGFDPLDIRTMRNKMKFKIKIISAQNLPTNSELIKDISDPYVSIKIYGVPIDKNEAKTQTVKDNGLNPIWNEDFEFTINCPELAFVKFIVKDEDVGNDDFIGQYTIRFQNIKQGYRHIALKNKSSKGTLFVGIRIFNLE
ncbi:unnamed protein product [Brachionus calyciflorus]|uniref:Phosphoinositide phospholipase C n=1 Tax=Brachionus calyciflorus TaxID=104777 RepID=A0A813Q2A1_9BILA|nr:unnamed protein product [Brachionus calyciflorus]